VRDRVAAAAGKRHTDRRHRIDCPRLGTITRSGGTRQVTYNGHPVYVYIGDKKPGDVNGQGVTAFGAAWYVVSPTGQGITRPLASSPAGTTSGY
jgi:Secreted repeat of unknown function